MLKNLVVLVIVTLSALSAVAFPKKSYAAGEVNVYSYRQEFLVEPMFKAFTEETGIKVNVVFAKDGITERLAREGEYSPADVLLTTDISRLLELRDENLVQAVNIEAINKAIPAQYRANDNTWFALTTRVRNIYSAKRLGKQELNYEDLADPKWHGKLCTRSGKHPYNLALVSSMIAVHGEANTLTWLLGAKENLARKPQGNDRGQVQAIEQGLCDISLGNSYYYGQMLSDENQKVWADSVYINFPNQNNRGAHVNISGMAMAKFSPNAEAAKALMTFLVSEKAQQMYAEINMEYPVRKGVALSPLVASWGEFKADTISLEEVAALRNTALKLLDKAQFDL